MNDSKVNGMVSNINHTTIINSNELKSMEGKKRKKKPMHMDSVDPSESLERVSTVGGNRQHTIMLFPNDNILYFFQNLLENNALPSIS